MPERLTVSSARPSQRREGGDAPPPDVADFIRFCYRRRAAAWPEIYDEMCAVAARREFNGWDHEQLAAHGLTFSLFEMPRLAAWVRATLPAPIEASDRAVIQPAST
jgi:hypothetical protein